MKLAISELHPNPFKKEINGGKMNEETIKKIMRSLDELDLMGAIPVVKREGKYCLVSHHHRVEAMKRKFGKNHQVEVIVHKYNDVQLLRGMIVENLTQRSDEFHEVTDNLLAIEKELNNNVEELKRVRESRTHLDKDNELYLSPKQTIHDEYKEKASSRDVAFWLDNGSGDIMSHDKITNCLNIKKNLDPELYGQIKNTQSGTAKEREDALQETQAIYLSKFEDKKEQKDLAHALKTAQEQRVRAQGKLISEYKTASEKTKEKVRAGEIKLDDVPLVNIKEKIEKRIKEDHEKGDGKTLMVTYRKYQQEAGARIGDANNRIFQACAFFDMLDKTNILLELDYKPILKIIGEGKKYGENYTKFMNKIEDNVK